MSVGFYPGTFDPVTLGHLDIITRAAPLFDRLIIGIAGNESKNPLLTLEERVNCLRNELASSPHAEKMEVIGFDGLLIDTVRSRGATCIVRGLRSASDFDFEAQLSGANRRLAPEIETVFMLASEEHRCTASRLVKEIARFGGDISGFVPAFTAQFVLSKLAANAP